MKIDPIRKLDSIKSVLMILLVASIPFGKIPIIAVLTSILIVISIVANGFSYTQILKKATPLLIPFLVILIWIIFSPSEFPEKMRYMEKYALMGLLPIAALTETSSPTKLYSLVCKAFVYSTATLLFITLAAATLNYFTKSSPTGRSTDWFFHVQLSNAFLEIHPTYISLCAIASVLIVLFALKSSFFTFSLIGFLALMVGILFVRITIIILVLIFVVYFTVLLFKGFKIKKLLIVSAIFTVAVIFFQLFSKLYDYEHRSVFVNVQEAWHKSNVPGVTYTDWGIVVRFAIWRAAFEVIKENSLLGVGPINENTAISRKFAELGHPGLVNEDFNAHNQLLSFVISYGIAGTAVILFACFLWVRNSWWNNNKLYLSMLAIIIICSFTESILNRAYGVCVFSFLNAFLFLHPSAPEGTKK